MFLIIRKFDDLSSFKLVIGDLLPFIISFVRIYQGWVLFGGNLRHFNIRK